MGLALERPSQLSPLWDIMDAIRVVRLEMVIIDERKPHAFCTPDEMFVRIHVHIQLKRH